MGKGQPEVEHTMREIIAPTGTALIHSPYSEACVAAADVPEEYRK